MKEDLGCVEGTDSLSRKGQDWVGKDGLQDKGPDCANQGPDVAKRFGWCKKGPYWMKEYIHWMNEKSSYNKR